MTISEADRTRFARDGVLGPYHHPLLDSGSAFSVRLLEVIRRASPRLAHPGNPPHEVLPRRLASGMTWFRSAHTLIPELWDLAEHPAILEPVTALLGPRVMWWGAQIVTKGPGDVHGWHFDTEFNLHDDGILVWIGLDGDVAGSSLKVITKTHHRHRVPVAYAGGVYGSTPSGNDILGDTQAIVDIAKRLDPSSELYEPVMNVGDFVVCHGHLWHGSIHRGNAPRTALTLSFSPPSADVRIPLSFDAEPIWHPERPKGVMLRGAADASTVNPILTARPGPV